MKKHMRIGTARTPSGRYYSVFVTARTYEDGRLSISGVEGPLRSGNCIGSCGQIDVHEWDIVNYAPGWSSEGEKRLRELWATHHMTRPSAEVLATVSAFPDSDKPYPWNS